MKVNRDTFVLDRTTKCIGDSIGGFVGNPMTHFMFNGVGTAPAANPGINQGIPFVLFAAFQLKFAIITPALITGSFAERVRFWSYIIFIVLWSILIYAPLAHWAWHPEGFLFKMGVLDFAGGTVVHISAGIAALIGARVLGRRKTPPAQAKMINRQDAKARFSPIAVTFCRNYCYCQKTAADTNKLRLPVFFVARRFKKDL